METTKKARTEQAVQAVAEAVNTGRQLTLKPVDFSDPNRERTCIEVDFPIIPINSISSLEASSGAASKPVYQISKWWARRQSSVFRSILLASVLPVPDESTDAAKHVWDTYYANHKDNPGFSHLTVADIFRGGGTTIVEGSRLGMKMIGNDLNPVAWFIVKTQLSPAPHKDILAFLKAIEENLRSQIMPFYACECPRGHKGHWSNVADGKEVGPEFDPLSLEPEQRRDYGYEGPEVIHTFWAKHGPCSATECGHRTPIMSDPIVVSKTVSVKSWSNWECPNCMHTFDIDQKDARLAPNVPLVISESEANYTVITDDGLFHCPHCSKEFRDNAAPYKSTTVVLGKAKRKKVDLTVLVHPRWLQGTPKVDQEGNEYGGSPTDSIESTVSWLEKRALTLSLIEVRGKLPNKVLCPTTGEMIPTRKGTVPRKSTFTCQADTCGQDHDILDAVKLTGKTGPMAPYAVQGYCLQCDRDNQPNGGRFIVAATNTDAFIGAIREWGQRRFGDLEDFWPTCELSFGWKTHGWAIPEHGYTHYWTMFNARQLLVHASLLKTIGELRDREPNSPAWESVLAAFQQYLRYNSGFTIWHRRNNQISGFLSNNSYQAKNTVVETSAFAPVGDGSWNSACRGLLHRARSTGWYQ